jgi:hypothetical protein
MQAPPPAVTWIRVDPPRFDLLGLIVASLGITGILAGVALVFGLGFGVWLIRSRRRSAASGLPPALGLDSAARN